MGLCTSTSVPPKSPLSPQNIGDQNKKLPNQTDNKPKNIPNTNSKEDSIVDLSISDKGVAHNFAQTLVATYKHDERPLGTTATAVLSSSMSNVETETACFGAGCYWGTEKYIRYDFMKKYGTFLGKVVSGAVGFMGPENAPQNPTYQQVCSGETGHVEVYQFDYTGGAACYEELVRFFFQFHDPTTANRQGNDRGTQYASVIYCSSDEQFEIATKVKQELQKLIDTKKITQYAEQTVATDIRKSTKFYPAHDEHQDYLNINPNGYCNHRIRFKQWPSL